MSSLKHLQSAEQVLLSPETAGGPGKGAGLPLDSPSLLRTVLVWGFGQACCPWVCSGFAGPCAESFEWFSLSESLFEHDFHVSFRRTA